MLEPKDPAIKLFGKTIPFPETSPPPAATTTYTNTAATATGEGSAQAVDDDINQDPPCSTDSSAEEEIETDEETLGEKPTETTKEEVEGPRVTSAESSNLNPTSGINENPKTPAVDDNTTHKATEAEEEQSESSGSHEKTVLKKPDKIIPCPRCNSMDTKFCYYNNYNVNQPRHFCKNCQRYWTAGGTMRNVPVGAGRRKNKNLISQYRNINVPEAPHQNARADLPNGFHHPSLKPNDTVLAFGPDKPLCESVASVLNIADKAVTSSTRNVYRNQEERMNPVSRRVENVVIDNASSVPDECGPQDSAIMQNFQAFPPQVPCFPGAPWPYPWNPAQWTTPIHPHAFCPPGYPMAIYPPPAYWGCTVAGTWNIPWLAPPPPSPTTPISSANSPTLGKHSRDENIATNPSNSTDEESGKENKSSEKCLWIPKTLRIDDPGEAAKSSIWATLGIKHDKLDSIGGTGLFKAFQSKNDTKNNTSETSPVLQANPAAMSRSINFHERS